MPICLGSILILPSHSHLRIPRGFLLGGLSVKTQKALLCYFGHICCPGLCSRFNRHKIAVAPLRAGSHIHTHTHTHIKYILSERYETLTLLGPNILLRILFSNTFNLYFSTNLRNTFYSHSIHTGNITYTFTNS